MTILECAQGSAEWQAARLGIPTASCFGRILTPGGALSEVARQAYLAELLAEWASSGSRSRIGTLSGSREGSILEPQARDYYAFHVRRGAQARLVSATCRFESCMVRYRGSTISLRLVRRLEMKPLSELPRMVSWEKVEALELKVPSWRRTTCFT